MRFIHAADLHLDSPLDGLSGRAAELAEAVHEASRRAFTGLIDTAVERRAAFLVIAGDVYDGTWRDIRTGLVFARAMARLEEAGIDAVLLKGNHDAVSNITKALRHGPNVHVFDHKRPQTIRLERHRAALHGRSYPTPAVTDNIVRDYPPGLPGWLNIGVLHTALEGAAGHAPYAPCSLSDLLAKSYQYWALGHVHAHQVLHQMPPVIYPGNIQGRHVNEPGAKGCVVVEAEDGEVTGWEFVALDAVRWVAVTVPAEGCDDLDALLERVRDRLAEAAEGLDGRVLAVRLTIEGASACHGVLHGNRAQAEAEIHGVANRAGGDVMIERLILRTRPLTRPAIGPDALGELNATFAALRDDAAERDMLRETLAAVLHKLPDPARQALDWASLDDDVLAAVLGDAQALLLERLQAEDAA